MKKVAPIPCGRQCAGDKSPALQINFVWTTLLMHDFSKNYIVTKKIIGLFLLNSVIKRIVANGYSPLHAFLSETSVSSVFCLFPIFICVICVICGSLLLNILFQEQFFNPLARLPHLNLNLLRLAISQLYLLLCLPVALLLYKDHIGIGIQVCKLKEPVCI